MPDLGEGNHPNSITRAQNARDVTEVLRSYLKVDD